MDWRAHNGPTWICRLQTITALHARERGAGLGVVVKQLRVGALVFHWLQQRVEGVVAGGVAVVVTMTHVRMDQPLRISGTPALTKN